MTSELEEGEEIVTDGETEHTHSYHHGTARPKHVSNMPIHQQSRVKTPGHVPTMALVSCLVGYNLWKNQSGNIVDFRRLSSWSQDYDGLCLHTCMCSCFHLLQCQSEYCSAW